MQSDCSPLDSTLCVQDTGFFCQWNGQWDSPYGRFFLEWYSNALVQHARSLLKAATSIFQAAGAPQCTLDNHIAPFTSAVHAAYGSHSNLASVSPSSSARARLTRPVH